MFQYFCRLFLQYDADVLPVAIFTDDARWRRSIPAEFAVRLPTRNVVRFEYELAKLKHLDYRAYLNSENPLAYALMAKMDYNRRERARLKADFLRMILGAGVDPARESLLADIVETYMPLNRKEQVEFQSVVVGDEQYEQVEKMITTYEQDGIEKGRKEGREEGRAEAQQKLLLRLLEKRFGPVPDAIKLRIRQTTSVTQLENLFEVALDAEALDDLKL